MGGELVIIEGTAEIIECRIPTDEDELYLGKYASEMSTLNMTVESFALEYPVRIHIRPARLRAS